MSLLQIMSIPYRPVHTQKEIDDDLDPALRILFKTAGLKAVWRGKKYEDRFTLIYLLLWHDLAASHNFILSTAYQTFNELIQPALNGRKLSWALQGLIGQSDLNDVSHLKTIVQAPVIEIALTKVVEGHVAAYYTAFRATVGPILDNDPGCGGWWISPQVGNPQTQVLLINWKSVDAHHEDFEKAPTFAKCIEALRDHYAEFVVPTHIIDLILVQGGL